MSIQAAQRAIPVDPITNLGFDTPSWQYFIRGIHVFASQGIEGLDLHRREDASPPRPACVQDIRPHVPGLRLHLSGYKMKKIHFFVLRNAYRIGCAPTWGSIPQSWQYYSWYSCICKSRHRALTCKCRLRGRVAPKLACVQDIRPHVPELGCTSAVQNEKYIFSFLYC